MVKCPNCGIIIKNKVYGCPYKVTRNRFEGKKLHLFEKRIKKRFEKGTEEINKFLEEFQGKIIKTNMANQNLLWNSLGDLERNYLDYNICIGILEKVEFNPNKGGHSWAKKDEQEQCPYMKEINGKSHCTCNTWVNLGEKVRSE